MKSFFHIISIVVLSAFALPHSPVFASSKDSDYKYGVFNHVGLQLGAGTEGFSAGLAVPFSPFFEIGIGANLMPHTTVSGNMNFKSSNIQIPQLDAAGLPTGEFNSYQLSTIRVKGDFSRVTFDAKLCLYPFGPRTTLFVAGGVSVGGERMASLSGHSDEVKRIYDENMAFFSNYENIISAIVDKSYIDIAKNGNLDADVHIKKVRPYIGAGFGRLVPRNGLGLRLEAGVQFTGRLRIYQDNNELNYNDLLKRADDRLSKLIDRMTVYPVIKLSITGKLL